MADELVGVLCSRNATVSVDAELLRWLHGYADPLENHGSPG